MHLSAVFVLCNFNSFSYIICFSPASVGKWGLASRIATQKTIADGLGLIPMDDPLTCLHKFDPPQRGWLYLKVYFLMGIRKTLHPRRILRA